MDNNKKPKKEIIGESQIMHVDKRFAIPVIVIFMTLLLIFSICWVGVLAADAICDNIINPIMLKSDPDAEPIDVMAVMNPPTSEQEAAKVYAKFPSLNLDKIGNAFGRAFNAFPESFGAMFSDIGNGIGHICSSFFNTLSNDPGEIGAWFSTELGTTVGDTASSVGNHFNIFVGSLYI